MYFLQTKDVKFQTCKNVHLFQKEMTHDPVIPHMLSFL